MPSSPQLISPSTPLGTSNSTGGPSSRRKVPSMSKTNVVLADTFPAKTHLLITTLTESDPTISSFSEDGTSFHIYDQATFSQTYLPQYFKHSNYGSFVRQLNLYGFTSSRLKVNSDVIVWTHEYFLRDRKDLLKKIKRAKKQSSKSSSTPSSSSKQNPPTRVDSPSSPSPHRVASPSFSEGGASETTDVEQYLSPPSTGAATAITTAAVTSPTSSSASNSNIANTSSSSSQNLNFARQVSGNDQAWFQSEFDYLKRQNRTLEQKLEHQSKFVEEKLELLLKLTLRLGDNCSGGGGGLSTSISGHGQGNGNYNGDYNGVYYDGYSPHGYYADNGRNYESGDKRRRMISNHHHHHHTREGGEETKMGDSSNYSEALAAWSNSVDEDGNALRPNNTYLGTIREEQKVEGHTTTTTTTSSYNHNEETLEDLEPMPYKNEEDENNYLMDRKSPPYLSNNSSSSNSEGVMETQYHGERGDSFQDFIDVMLKDDDDNIDNSERVRMRSEEEQKINERSSSENSSPNQEGNYTTATTAVGVAAIPNVDALDDDELMAEAIDSILPELDEVDSELIEDLQTQHQQQQQQQKPGWVANATVDKVTGPAPIAVVSSANDVPTYESGDIEEGGMGGGVPGVTGVAVVASLVESNNEVRNNNGEDLAAAEQRRLEEERQQQSYRKRKLYIMSFIAFVVVVMAVTIPSVLVAKSDHSEEDEHEAGLYIKCPKAGCKKNPPPPLIEDAFNQDGGKGKYGQYGYLGGDAEDSLDSEDSNLFEQSVTDSEGSSQVQDEGGHDEDDATPEDQEQEQAPDDDDTFFKFGSIDSEDLLPPPLVGRRHHVYSDSQDSGDYDVAGRLRSSSLFVGGLGSPTFSSFSLSIQGTDFVCTQEIE